ncbi:DUF995 domain-containing protein [Chelativorans xinjiangense]|uniref:DUF995 domain-containing protein n=1 Tax=Chelativorans xinjiangense TaxID=2681485 RepID=UPI00135783E1|nr:DUF995 domain-containing protein [Chelativorans xinjiangense]
MTTKQTIESARRPFLPVLRPAILSRVLAGLLMLSGEGWAAAAKVTPPEDARAMTGVELYMLYRNKSWKWEHGAGRMEDEGRAFKAWSESGDSQVWATGRWIVTDQGLFCMKADWHTPTGTYANKTCFKHRISDLTIYQKREPSGDWYVFRHTVPKDSDEFAKLVSEDLVSSKLEFVETSPKDGREKTSLQQQTTDDAERKMEN